MKRMGDLMLIIGVLICTYHFMTASVNADVSVFSEDIPHEIVIQFRDMPALFGGIIPPEGIRTKLVYADPPDACTPIKPPPRNASNFLDKWAVLIRRCGCLFETKIRKAQNASYDLAIVHNVNSSELEAMSAADPHGIYIPSVFIGSLAGNTLKEEYLYNSSFYIKVDDESPDDINKHLLVPFAIVVGICFFIMLGFMVGVVVKCIQDRRRARRHRMPNSSLKKIPTAKYQKGDPYETCAICIEDYVENDKLRILPCSHAYHAKCVDPWLTRNRRVCPICKRKVFAAGEKPHSLGSSDSESDGEGIVDDRTPLFAASNNRSNQTRGGTFDNMSENPLTRQGRPLWHDSISSANDTSDSGSLNSHRTASTANDLSDNVSINSTHHTDLLSIIRMAVDRAPGSSRTVSSVQGGLIYNSVIPETRVIPNNNTNEQSNLISGQAEQSEPSTSSKWYTFWK